MIKKTYSENQAIIRDLWKQYQKDNNPKWLADICLSVPFFDHPEVGKEIAKLLEKKAQPKSNRFYLTDVKAYGIFRHDVRYSKY